MLENTRLYTVALLSAALFLMGCGDDDSPPSTEGGVMLMEAGPTPEAGPPGPMPEAGPPPMMSGCPMGPCDVATGAGCMAGEACYFLSPAEGEPSVPICQPAGAGTDGATCASYGDCASGYFCAASGSSGVCRKMCCMNNDAQCPSGQTCQVQLVDAAGNPSGVGLCRGSDGCDVLAQTGCPEGEGCYPVGTGSTCAMPRPGAEGGGQGATCMTANGCNAGFICAGSGDESTCSQACSLADGGEPSCADGFVCGMLTGITEFGICQMASGM